MEIAQDNTEALTRLAQTSGWLTANNSIVNLTVAGEGNMNRVLRAQLACGQTLIFKQSLPYVAKYPDIPAPVERLDVEADFYAAISQHPDLAAHMPTIVGYDRSERVLCMQDLGAASDLTDLYAQNSTDKHEGRSEHTDIIISRLIDWLGTLHALQLTDQQISAFDNQAMRTLNHEHIFVIPLLKDNGLQFDDDLSGCAAQFRADKTFTDTTAQLGEIYLGNLSHASKPCLLQGDFYPGSWVAHDTKGVMIIDPEFGFYGAPEFDLGVMLAHLTFAGFSQTNIEHMLRAYVRPKEFSDQLTYQFAGIEITRRLLGVAQLPMQPDNATKLEWLSRAHQWVTVT